MKDKIVLRQDGRRFTTVFYPNEWAKIEAEIERRREQNPRVTASDVVRELVRSLPG